MSVSLQRNTGASQARNAGGSKNYPLNPAYFQLIKGLVPICGFGKFTSATNFNSLSPWDPSQIGGANYNGVVFTDLWPNVYTVLTETISGGGNSGTRTVTTSTNWDQLFVQVVVDPSGLFGINGFIAPGTGGVLSAGNTVFTQIWTDSTPTTWTYIATVSSQLNYSSWSTWTTQATGLLADFPFPTFTDATYYTNGPGVPSPGACACWLVVPISTGPNYEIIGGSRVGTYGDYGSTWTAQFSVEAACYGAAIRASGGNTPWNAGLPTGNYWDIPVASAYVQDEPSPSSIAGTTLAGNFGFVACSSSRWELLGSAPNWSTMPDNNTPHLSGLWAQPMTVGQPPAYTASYSLAGATGLGLLEIDSALVNTVLGTYGMIGFRHP